MRGALVSLGLVGRYTQPSPKGTVGGFKVERYVDAAGGVNVRSTPPSPAGQTIS